jgi:hypothetical protein
MLTNYDELMCHQVVSTFDRVGTSAREWTERLWFCAHDTTGKLILVAGFGVYANRNIIDAFACLAVEGKTQYNVRASRELRPRIDEVAVGPFSYDVIEPLKKLRWVLAENEHDLSYDIQFEATMYAHPEEPQLATFRGRIEEHVQRYFQVGRPSGWIKVEGKTYQIDRNSWRAERDHSWGVRRGGGVPETGVQPGEIPEGYLYNMIVSQFEGFGATYHTRETWEEKSRHFSGGVYYPLGSGKEEIEVTSVNHNFQFRPDIRQISGGEVLLNAADGSSINISVRPLSVCYLKPGGYFGYKDFVHGMWMGPYFIDSVKLDLTDPGVIREISFLDDVMCEMRCGDEIGYGIVEMVVVGKYPRYGYQGY